MIGIQIVNRIQSLHSEGYLHRDIKPDNFLIGSGNRDKKDGSVIHMIDMGLAKSFRDSSGEHIPMRSGKRLTGTPRYASINTHEGYEQSRRDDLESLCYILIYFLRGKLPWQGMQGSTKATKYDLIRKKKIATSPEKLCQNLPEEFINFLNYVRKLEFKQEPDYKFLKKLLQLCCQRVEGTKIDWRFAWQNPHEKKDATRKRSICKEKDSHDKSDESSLIQTIQTPKSQAEDSVQCLSKPPSNKTQQQPLVVSTEKIREKDSAGPTMPTPEEQLRMVMENFGGDTQRFMRSYYEITRERDELKKKCYAYELSNLKLKKDLENARYGRKRKKGESGSHARAKRPRIGDPHSPIQIE
jgi:serine/threonine protein kinase